MDFVMAMVWMIGPVVLLASICGGYSAWIAGTKGRSMGAWFLLGLITGPLAMLAVGLGDGQGKN